MKLTTRAVRRIAASAAAASAVLLLPGLALAAPGSPAAPAAPAARAVPRACETPGLVIWINTNGSGTAGSTFYHLEFTNLSGHRCTLNGFPFVRAIDLHRHRLGSRAAFTRTAHSVTIGRGKTATAVLQIVDAGNFPASVCHPVTAAGLRVFPPNQTRSKLIPFPFRACSRTGPVYLIVRPVRK